MWVAAGQEHLWKGNEQGTQTFPSEEGAVPAVQFKQRNASLRVPLQCLSTETDSSNKSKHVPTFALVLCWSNNINN